MCKKYDENASCYIQSKKIDYCYNADLAACPGIYVGVGSGEQRKMCLQVSAWKEFFGPNSLKCVDIPSKCRKVENINEISKQSGYAIWDSTQDINSEKPQIGRCGTAAQGFEEAAEVSITTNCNEIKIYKSSTESTAKSGNTKKTNVEKDNAAKDNTTNNNPNDDESKTIDQIATDAAKEKCFNKTAELSKLQNYIKGGDIYFNLPSFQSEENLKYNRENKPPTRQCKTDGTLFGTIQNSCKFISNCVGNTEPVPVTGNTAWESFLDKAGDAVKVTDGEKENTYNVMIGRNSYKGIQSDTASIQGYNFIDVLIPGICNGVVNYNTTRACRVFYDNDNKVIFSGWTDTIIGEKCSK